MPENAPRELILKLGQMITDRLGHKVTVDDPEYYGLACIVTDEMAEVALKMKVRQPKTLAQLVKLTGKDPAHLEQLLFDMSYVGLIEFNWENPQREKQYVLPMFVPGSAEFSNMRRDQLEAHPELARFFERMTFLPLEKVTAMVPPGGAGIGMHVIPVEQAIEAENQSVDVEHISHWLEKYDGKYAASPCSCRMGRAVLGEGCADDPEDWCIGVGDMADYLVETNKGHYVDRAEVLRILKHAEDNGFVHQITNIDGENKIFAICNCNVNICNALRTSQLFNTPNMSRSAYVAKVETENCVACGRCVEYCPAGAVKLGQKLCTVNGPVQYPRQELPDAVAWGPEKWDPDYRDHNRVNCHDTGTAPCKTACPAHIAVQGYLKMAAQGRYTEALALIKKENPFPAVCGRVCNRRCEDACTRGSLDAAVAIDEVKKFIAQQDLNAATRYVPPVVQPSNRGPFPQKIAVIGGGPAGLSCAYWSTASPPISWKKTWWPPRWTCCARWGSRSAAASRWADPSRWISCAPRAIRPFTLPSAARAAACRASPAKTPRGCPPPSTFCAAWAKTRPCAWRAGPWSSAAATWPSTRPGWRAAAAPARSRCTAWSPGKRCPPRPRRSPRRWTRG